MAIPTPVATADTITTAAALPTTAGAAPPPAASATSPRRQQLCGVHVDAAAAVTRAAVAFSLGCRHLTLLVVPCDSNSCCVQFMHGRGGSVLLRHVCTAAALEQLCGLHLDAAAAVMRGAAVLSLVGPLTPLVVSCHSNSCCVRLHVVVPVACSCVIVQTAAALECFDWWQLPSFIRSLGRVEKG